MLKKLTFKAGINRELTRYASEGGWYDCDKVRFRQSFPEKIGGWVRMSTDTYIGTCRSLWNWVTLGYLNLLGVGTNEKFYIERGGVYNDVTPIRATATLSDPFATTDGLTTITVTDAAHGASTGDYVTFSSADAVAGLDLNNEYKLTKVDANTYTFTAASAANATVVAGGGAAVSAAYQISIGAGAPAPIIGWGAGGMGDGAWGEGVTNQVWLRLWSQDNFGEDLVFAPRHGALYFWDATNGVGTRAVLVSSIGGATDVPTRQTTTLVTDNRFVFALGTNDYLSATLDPLLVRWSDQESVTNWTPGVSSKSGSLPLAYGSQIITGRQVRQEVLVWTDSALYSLQFTGYPDYWAATLVGDNLSIMGPNATASVGGVAYWMGRDNFYMYDGRVQPLRCDVDQYVFGDLDLLQAEQVFAGTNEGFNEIWWFYCAAGSTSIDRYVVYNYVENIWYYGNMARSAWLDSGIRERPMAATYSNNVVYHEQGTDSDVDGTPVAIEASITSAHFDLDDGHHFMFVRRVLPDVTFRGSTANTPAATMYLYPLQNSGAGYRSPASSGGSNSAAVSRVTALPVEEFTGQAFVRVRARQMALKFESTALGVHWQLGAPRLDMRPDGRRGA